MRKTLWKRLLLPLFLLLFVAHVCEATPLNLKTHSAVPHSTGEMNWMPHVTAKRLKNGFHRWNALVMSIIMRKRMVNRHFYDLTFLDILQTSSSFLTPWIPRYHIILLNQPLPPSTLQFLKHAKTILCADGAANHLYAKQFDSNVGSLSPLWPTLICGDFDSIEPHVLSAYRSLGVDVIFEADQNSTDTQKCWKHLLPRLKEGDKIIILGGVGGRLDHTVSNLSFLYNLQRRKHGWFDQSLLILNQYEIYILGENTLCFLLPPGVSKIQLPFKYLSSTCGLLPLGKACRFVNSSGLRWNLKGDRLNLGGLVSSSNQVVDSSIEIETSDPLLWFSELKG